MTGCSDPGEQRPPIGELIKLLLQNENRNLKGMTIAIVWVCMMPWPAFAQDKSYAAINWLGSYVYSSGAEAYSHPVIQPEVGIVFESGFDLLVWGSLPASMNHVFENKATEVDINFGYALGSFRIGVEYYFLAPTAVLHNDSVEVNAQIAKQFTYGKWTIGPAFRIDYDMPVDEPHNKDTTGLYLFPSIDLSYSEDPWTFSLGNRFIADLGGYGADIALISKITPNVGFRFAKALTANVGAEIYVPVAKSGKDSRHDYYVPKIGVTFSF